MHCSAIIPKNIADYLLILQGNIASWKKKEGEEFAAGDVLAEIETDKVSHLGAMQILYCCFPEAAGAMQRTFSKDAKTSARTGFRTICRCRLVVPDHGWRCRPPWTGRPRMRV